LLFDCSLVVPLQVLYLRRKVNFRQKNLTGGELTCNTTACAGGWGVGRRYGLDKKRSNPEVHEIVGQYSKSTCVVNRL